MQIKLNAKEKITKAKIRLQKSQPFWSYLVLHLKTEELPEDQCDGYIAGVDENGKMFYNPEEVLKLPIKEVEGLLCHEIFHVAFQHMARLKVLKNSEQAELWNIAADILVNYNILRSGMKLPAGGIFPNIRDGSVEIGGARIENIQDKSVETIFHELLKQADKVDRPKRFDKHTPGKGNKDSTTAKDRADMWKKVLSEASTFAEQRGCMPGNMKKMLDNLLNPIVDWRNILYKYITNSIPFDFTYIRPHKKSLSIGIYMPNILKENLEVVIGVDTSGSISKQDYTDVMTEVVGMSKQFSSIKMTVIGWDTEVDEPLVIENGNIDRILKAELRGGGGTDINCLFKEVIDNHNKTRVLIVLTDGYFGGIDEEPNCNLVYLLTRKNSRSDINSGKVIEIRR